MTTNMQADVMENSVCDEAANQRELKKQWRAHAIARRKQTSKEERLEAGRKLAEQARKANLIHSFTTVAAFASMGSEMSMMPMLQALFDSNCHVLVPRLGSGMDIGWSELGDIHDLQDQTNSDGSINTHRPQEPGNSANGPEALKNAGLIIVPALAVDQEDSVWDVAEGGMTARSSIVRPVHGWWRFAGRGSRRTSLFRTKTTIFPSMACSLRTDLRPYANKTSEDKTFTQPSQGTY